MTEIQPIEVATVTVTHPVDQHSINLRKRDQLLSDLPFPFPTNSRVNGEQSALR